MNEIIKSYADISIDKQLKEEEGILYIKGIASTMVDTKGNLAEDRDGEVVDLLSGVTIEKLTNGFMPLFIDHKPTTDNLVGKVSKVELVGKQLHFEAEVHKDLNERIYKGVKSGLFSAVSIGFRAKDYDVENISGKSVGVLKDLKIHEISIVALPANTGAVFSVTGSKSLSLTQPIADLKEINPECKGFDCQLKNKSITIEDTIKEQEVDKGLTIAETESETWNVWDKVSYEMQLLYQTLDSNFWGEKWDDLDKTQMLQNIRDAFGEIQKRVEDILTIEQPQIKEMENKEMEIKKEMAQEEIKSEKAEAVQEVVQDTVASQSPQESSPNTGNVEIETTETQTAVEPLVLPQAEEEAPKVEDTTNVAIQPNVTLGSLIDYQQKLDLNSLTSTHDIEALALSIQALQEKLGERYLQLDPSIADQAVAQAQVA